MLRILLNKVIYKVKFKQTIIKYYLFGIPFYKKKYHKKDDLENLDLSAKKFHRFNTNDECLLAKLKNMGDFTYIPNPGNMGDMLIAAATLQFFDRNHLSYTMINSSKKLNTIVYGGGGFGQKIIKIIG